MLLNVQSSSRSTPILVSRTRPWPSSTRSSTTVSHSSVPNRLSPVSDWFFITPVFERVAQEASKLASYSKKSTISSREIQTAVRLILPGELSKHAISEGTKVSEPRPTEGRLSSNSYPSLECHQVLGWRCQVDYLYTHQARPSSLVVLLVTVNLLYIQLYLSTLRDCIVCARHPRCRPEREFRS